MFCFLFQKLITALERQTDGWNVEDAIKQLASICVSIRLFIHNVLYIVCLCMWLPHLEEAPVLAGIAKNSHGCSPLLSLELLHVDHWERIHFSLLIVFLLKLVYVCCLAMETRADEGGIYST